MCPHVHICVFWRPENMTGTGQYLLEPFCHFHANRFQAAFIPRTHMCLLLWEPTLCHAQRAEGSWNLLPKRQPNDWQVWGYKYTSPLAMIKITLMCTLYCHQKPSMGWGQRYSLWQCASWLALLPFSVSLSHYPISFSCEQLLINYMNPHLRVFFWTTTIKTRRVYYKKNIYNFVWSWMVTRLVGVISQCLQISNYYIAHLKQCYMSIILQF